MVSHPLNDGRAILLPDREVYDPDVCLVCESGIGYVKKGEVWIVMFERGAYYPDMSPDGREVRIVGAYSKGSDKNKPWGVFLARYGEGNTIAPGPGWMLVEEERIEYALAVPDSFPRTTGMGTVLAGSGVAYEDGRQTTIDLAGLKIPIAGSFDPEMGAWVGTESYGFHGRCVPDTWRLVRNTDVPVSYLRRLAG